MYFSNPSRNASRISLGRLLRHRDSRSHGPREPSAERRRRVPCRAAGEKNHCLEGSYSWKRTNGTATNSRHCRSTETVSRVDSPRSCTAIDPVHQNLGPHLFSVFRTRVGRAVLANLAVRRENGVRMKGSVDTIAHEFCGGRAA